MADTKIESLHHLKPGDIVAVRASIDVPWGDGAADVRVSDLSEDGESHFAEPWELAPWTSSALREAFEALVEASTDLWPPHAEMWSSRRMDEVATALAAVAAARGEG